MKRLLIVTAVVEVSAGFALGIVPSQSVAALFGCPLMEPVAVVLGRITGAALLALGLASWLARFDENSAASKGLVGGLLVYNLGVLIILLLVGLQPAPVGVALWPAVILHAIMSTWCIAALLRKSPSSSNS